MRTRRQSIIFALIATIVGLALFFYDDILDHTDQLGTTLHDVTRSIEFLLLGPGMGLLAFSVCEYLRLVNERLQIEREQAHQKRFMLLGRIAASIAHEVRNPLHNLRLLLDEKLLSNTADHSALDARVQANLERINRAVELVYQLANPTTPSSDVEVGADVNVLVREAVSAVTHNGAANISTHYATGPALIACPAVVVRIGLDNLLRNAVTASANEIIVNVRANSETWEVEIRNPGTLPTEVLHDDDDDAGILVPSVNGLGLGLFITRRLVGNVGGSLNLHQSKGYVTAIMHLPKWAPPA
jgi:signal transduction histidine kinase